MGKSHLSRLATPNTWGVARKGKKWIARPLPGPHALKHCLTLNILMKNNLEHVKTTKELKKILNDKAILVDKIVRKEYRFPVGFMDVVEIPKLNESYRIIYDTKGKLVPINSDSKETNLKLIKVIGKSLLKGGKMQFNLHDGKNILVDKKVKANVGDTVLYDLTKKVIVKSFTLEKGASVFLTGGKYVGSVGKIKDVQKPDNLERSKLVFETNGKEHITLLDYAFVVGSTKPEVSLEAGK